VSTGQILQLLAAKNPLSTFQLVAPAIRSRKGQALIEFLQVSPRFTAISLPGSLFNPTYPLSTMPSPTAENPDINSQQTDAQPNVGRDPKVQRVATEQAIQVPSPSEPKLSGAELKKLKAAEKAARRKVKITVREDAAQSSQNQQMAQKPDAQRRPSVTKRSSGTGQHKHTGSTSGKPSTPRGGTSAAQPESEKKPGEDKRVTFFSHLYGKDRKLGISGAGREIHPAVLALGLQLRDHVICGGNARCVATLLVFKKVELASFQIV